MDFADPRLLWLLLAAPLAGGLAWLAWRRRLAAMAAWAARGLWDRLLPGFRPRRLAASALLLAVAVLAVALALARPRWGMGEHHVERQGVDVVFVLDTSLSMATRDVRPSRLWVAQTLIRDLVGRLEGDRVALVQAEGEGVVMVPLTLDAAVIDLLLDAVQPGSLPTPGTELAWALERALELFPEGSEKHRVIVLVSDGEDHGSPLRKVENRLREAGVVVHAIGVGTPQGKPLELPGTRPGQPVSYKQDEDGNVVVSRLEEAKLEELARATGGVYLRATSAAADTGPIVSRIRGMETRSFGSDVASALEERFQLPLALAILALVLYLTLPVFAPARKGVAP
ncbi:MAG: VWA domain-containing protein [Acidobacteria bacterium]|nr:MAG: VWA domain-containing protein [Acidobacteriota bacterium]